MLLCKDGATYDVLEEVLERLKKHERKEMLSITRFFAGKVFTSSEDQERLEGRFTVLRDFLEDSWTFQETLEEGRVEGRKQGLERGLERGLEQGRIEEARQSIEGLVEKRFPTSLAWVKVQVESISDLETLRNILSALFIVNTAEEVMHSFSALH